MPYPPQGLSGYDTSQLANKDLSNVNDVTILNKLKNVDGTGSGLDTDLVRGLPADFTSSKTSSGYQKLPSGLIIQWGKINVQTTAYYGTVNVYFPIAFPTAILNLTLGNIEEIGSRFGSYDEGWYQCGMYSITNNGFTFKYAYAYVDNFNHYYVAIGY